MGTIIIIMALGAISYWLIPFIKELFNDSQELKGTELSEKFSTLVGVLNEWTYKGYGTVRKIDKQQFNLYKEHSCQIINFFYATGFLTITWRFKYWQQEVVYKKDLKNARDVTEEEQIRFAKLIIREFADTVEIHKRKIDNNANLGNKYLSQDQKKEKFLNENNEYKEKLLSLYHNIDEKYERKYSVKIFNDLPFSRNMETRVILGAIFSGIKEVEKFHIVDGKYEFVFAKGFGNLDKHVSIFYVFNLLAKYCYKITSYNELKNRCYNSNDPSLIQLIESLSQYQSDENTANVTKSIVSELISLLDRKELNPNITINDIVAGEINTKILIINPMVYLNIFKSIIEKEHKNIIKTYYSNGNIENIVECKDGMQHGSIKSFFPSGCIKTEGKAENGCLNGLAIEYYENGKICRKSNYINDCLHGIYEEYKENGLLGVKGEYINGKKEGKWQWYYDSLIPCQMIIYKDNKEITKIRYNQDGIAFDDRYPVMFNLK